MSRLRPRRLRSGRRPALSGGAAAAAGREGRRRGPCPARRPLGPMARLLLRLLVLLLCAAAGTPLAAAAAGRSSGPLNSKCGTPEPIENAQIAEGSSGDRLRYSCVQNYKRKAGTSSLIVCEEDKEKKEFRWTKAQLECIADPSLPPPPRTTTEDSRIEAETSAPATTTPKTTGVNPSVVSLRPYGSETASQPTSGPASSTPPGTAEPSPDRPIVPTTAAGEVGSRSPGAVTKSVTLPQRAATPASQARTSTVPTTGNRSTAVPSAGATVSATQSSDTSSPRRLTGSPYFRIGLPLLVVFIVLLCFLLWYVYRGQRRRTGVPLVEGTSFALMPSEGSNWMTPSASDQGNPGAGDEGAPMLSPHDGGGTSTG